MSPTECRKVYMNKEAPPVEGYYNIAPNSPEKLIPSEIFESIFFLFLRPLRNSKRRNTRRLGLDSPLLTIPIHGQWCEIEKKVCPSSRCLSPFAFRLGLCEAGRAGRVVEYRESWVVSPFCPSRLACRYRRGICCIEQSFVERGGGK